jgi:hypothetical protein
MYFVPCGDTAKDGSKGVPWDLRLDAPLRQPSYLKAHGLGRASPELVKAGS